jgi:hypothetical protein
VALLEVATRNPTKFGDVKILTRQAGYGGLSSRGYITNKLF